MPFISGDQVVYSKQSDEPVLYTVSSIGADKMISITDGSYFRAVFPEQIRQATPNELKSGKRLKFG